MVVDRSFSPTQRLSQIPKSDKLLFHLERIKSLKIQRHIKKKKMFSGVGWGKTKNSVCLKCKGREAFLCQYLQTGIFFKNIQVCPSFNRVRKPSAFTLLFFAFDICQVSRTEGPKQKRVIKNTSQ